VKLAFPPLWFALSLGCLSAPQLVVVDRATALEEQASGSFDELERKLIRAGIAPHPVPFTPEELEALGIRTEDVSNTSELTEADQVDRLLRQRCLGEGKDGLLVETPDTCTGAADPEAMGQLVERGNRARLQLWKWMQAERPKASLEQVRRAWKAAHDVGLVCGGWRQREDGSWEAKAC
jgi:hypothetical protein